MTIDKSRAADPRDYVETEKTEKPFSKVTFTPGSKKKFHDLFDKKKNASKSGEGEEEFASLVANAQGLSVLNPGEEVQKEPSSIFELSSATPSPFPATKTAKTPPKATAAVKEKPFFELSDTPSINAPLPQKKRPPLKEAVQEAPPIEETLKESPPIEEVALAHGCKESPPLIEDPDFQVAEDLVTPHAPEKEFRPERGSALSSPTPKKAPKIKKSALKKGEISPPLSRSLLPPPPPPSTPLFANAISRTEAPIAPPRQEMQAIIEQISSALLKLTMSDRVDTSFTIAYPPLFEGSTVTLSEYHWANKEYNISFCNLSMEAKALIDLSLHQESLKMALQAKGLFVHNIISSLDPYSYLPNLDLEEEGQMSHEEAPHQFR